MRSRRGSLGRHGATLAHTDKFKSEPDQQNIKITGEPGAVFGKGSGFPINGRTYYIHEDATISSEGEVIVAAYPHKP